MSIDNPFAAPLAKNESEPSLNVFRVDGDTLICGAETNLQFLCWLTGEWISAEDRPTHHTPVSVYWPAPLRRVRQLLLVGAVLTFPLMVARRMWGIYMVACTAILLLVFIKRMRPKVTLRTAVSPRGQRLPRRHNIREVLRFLFCGLATLTVLRFAPGAFAAVGLPVSSYVSVIMASSTFLLTGWLSRVLVRPVLSVRPPTVDQMQNDLFVVRHIPENMLQGLQQLRTELMPDAEREETAS
ncbi:MAG: hypothetical protein NXI04_13825 [Planctomycetaceae bacterium]|nr:hypothetical protein [Planctomycetaceae bacterium]